MSAEDHSGTGQSMLLTTEFTFDAAHRILGHQGKCGYLHGHTYRLEVAVGAEHLDRLGMIMDVDDLRALVRKAVLDRQIQRKVDEQALVVPSYYVPFFRGAAWKWIRFPAWLSQKYHDDFYDPFSGTTGYVGYFWVDADIRREVLEAQRSGKAYPPRIIKDETYRR